MARRNDLHRGRSVALPKKRGPRFKFASGDAETRQASAKHLIGLSGRIEEENWVVGIGFFTPKDLSFSVR